ncbi:MAG TPA: SDR family NAD(P)-dependent oxidoreductase [Gammaproteobacteria bacterium]|nr:SDR family NAD(P)-dependent oxidoreductase [Gammaproteobacteria bacterium]
MRTALVTGGSQGVGKGVVEGLAEAGFRVYFTGRNVEALERTAEAASALGGEALARRVDHGADSEVALLFEEIAAAGALDVLVNNVWGGYERMVENGRFTWLDPFWEQPLWRWDAMMTTGVRAAFVASQLATRLMLPQARGLIVNISFWPAQKHIGNALYGIAKAATDKLTADMSFELRDKGIDAVSLYPGLVRTEKVMQYAEHMDLSNSESPRFQGRVTAALHSNPALARALRGTACVSADLALRLGVEDIDGRRPVPLTLASV